MRKTLTFLALAAFVAGSIGATPALAAPSVAEILDANHAAMGGDAWNGKTTVKVEYAYAGQGMTGKTDTLADLTRPRFVQTYEIGPVSGANGFDGEQAWEKDPSGTVDVQAGGDARQRAINEGYREANLWWQPGRAGAEIKNDGVKTADGQDYDVLSVTPKDGKPFEAWFDTKTHLLYRVVEKAGALPITTTLSDYAEEGDVVMAHKIVVSTGDKKYDQTLSLNKAAFVAPAPDSAYAMPQTKVSDYSIEGGASQTVIPFKLINNHIYANASVNGQGPFQFIFDTGGVNLVAPATAEKLGLKAEGDMEARGAGEGTMKASLAKVDELMVGDARIGSQVFIIIPLDAMKNVEGVDMPGMVGFETFRRFVTRIDYGNKTITLIDPAHFDPKDAGTPVPFTLNGRIPEVKGSFEGIPATWDIDTGARSSLTLTKPFSEENKLRDSHPKGVSTVDGWGVGGPSTGYVTRGRKMMLGSIEIPGIVTTFADQDKGAFAGSDYSGNVGGGILKRFVVTFDYHNKIMYLKPLPGPVADIDTFDRAGMWFNEGEKGFDIVHVTTGSPAEKAGLTKGDVITAVDGTPASAIKLYDLRQHLRDEAPGTKVTFTILRDGKSQTVPVTLESLI